MANFVLVHGAFHGAWSLAELAQELRNAGHTVLTPDLPGAGEDSTPLGDVTLASATERVFEALRSLDGPAILVGHSMGGVVITQAAAKEPTRVSRLIYLTAFRPVDGESLLDLTGLPEGANDGVQANITLTEEPPLAIFDRDKADYVFYHDVAPEVAERATERLAPQPLSVFATPVELGDSVLPPVEYVVCTEDNAIPPELQRLMAKRNPAMVHELAASHSPFYSLPDEVLRLLTEAAERASLETSK